MKALGTIAVLAMLFLLSACEQSQATIQDATPTAGASATLSSTAANGANMEIVQVQELQPYQVASVKGDTSVTWTPVSSSPLPPGDDQAALAVQAAIKSQAARLANVDYSALSIPAYVTVTKSLKPTPADFSGDQLRVDFTGEAGGEKVWALYSWQGPEIPQLPDRPQVNRWVQIYALYDLKQRSVVRLIATVRGQANE